MTAFILSSQIDQINCIRNQESFTFSGWGGQESGDWKEA